MKYSYFRSEQDELCSSLLLLCLQTIPEPVAQKKDKSYSAETRAQSTETRAKFETERYVLFVKMCPLK